MIELSLTQMAAQMSVSERTALRYMDKGVLTAQKTARGKYRVDPEELQRLKKYEPDELAELREEIAQLRQQVEDLTRELRETRRPGATPTRTHTHTPRVFTEGTQTARSFGEAHGIKRDQMQGWVSKGFFPSTAVDLNGRTQYQLTPEQQASCIRWMREYGASFQPCPQCPHESLS